MLALSSKGEKENSDYRYFIWSFLSLIIIMHTFDNDLALISDVTLWPLIWLQFDITKVDFRGLIKGLGGQFSLRGIKGLTGG